MKNSLLYHEKKIIAFVKKSLEDEPLVDDLGDYIPLLAYYKEDAFCRNQIELSVKFHVKKGLFYGKAYPKLRLFEKHIIIPEMNTDALLGLIDYYRLSKWQPALGAAEDVCASLRKNLIRKNHICWLFVPAANICLPFSRGVNGMFIELFVDMHEITGKKEYILLAQKLSRGWLEMDFFKKHGLFPNMYSFEYPFLNRFIRSSHIVRPFKHNSSIINGLLALYKMTGDRRSLNAIYRWIGSVQMRLFDGYIYGMFDSRDGRKSQPELQYAFPIIDILCDTAAATGDENLLDFAEEIARKWLEHLTPLGLIPNEVGEKGTFIDALTDFSLSLFRLHELTKNKRYHDIGRKVAEANLAHHLCAPDESYIFEGCKPSFLDSYTISVDEGSGEIIKKLINPKFVALLLKPIIYLESGEKIYKNQMMFKLMRDR